MLLSYFSHLIFHKSKMLEWLTVKCLKSTLLLASVKMSPTKISVAGTQYIGHLRHVEDFPRQMLPGRFFPTVKSQFFSACVPFPTLSSSLAGIT